VLALAAGAEGFAAALAELLADPEAPLFLSHPAASSSAAASIETT